ncbi:MAG: hypothetical protein HOE90_06940 [Bacteriovoracaceae bacterium]|jgi:hypothetical protein|nr:hypothetical protein [Bacteriovoracaceae bacterium]
MATKRKATTTKRRTPAKTTTRKTTTSARKATSTRRSKEMLLVGSKTKEALKSHKLNVSGDALEGINQWVYWLIDQAACRAKANGRKTVRAHDFMA